MSLPGVRRLVRPLRVLLLGLSVAALSALPGPVPVHEAAAEELPRATPTLEMLGGLPLTFEENCGQTDAAVRFVTRDRDGVLYLTAEEAVWSLRAPDGEPTVLRMAFEGADPDVVVRGDALQPGRSQYFSGDDPARWQGDVPRFGRVVYEGIYAGIDLLFYGNQRRLEYDFVVAPGADPAVIELTFEGAEELALDALGQLVLSTAVGPVIQRAPVLYQQRAGQREPVAGSWRLHGERRVGFEVGAYDPARPLIIDPVVELLYSSYLGGTGSDAGQGVAVDAAGNMYLVGNTNSLDFPTANAWQPAKASAGTQTDAFVTKLDPSGSMLVFSTYLGGMANASSGRGIALDGAGNIWIVGTTSATDFPVTMDAAQPIFGGGSLGGDAFVAKLDPSGSLSYASYLGGSADESGLAVAVDGTGCCYVTGTTPSGDFPTTMGAYDTTHNSGNGTSPRDAFVAKFDPSGGLAYASYIGGSLEDIGLAIAVDGTGSAYLCGQTISNDFPTTGAFQPTAMGNLDVWVVKLDLTAGAGLTYSTYLGGSGRDEGFGIAVDASGNAHVVGQTRSSDFPTTGDALQTTFAGNADAFLVTLGPSGSSLLHGTFLGGSGSDAARCIALDADGNRYLSGGTTSGDFPTVDPVQSTKGTGQDGFVSRIEASGALGFSTFLGGSGGFPFEQANAIAVDGAGTAYAAGLTAAADFPTVDPLQVALGGGNDAFIAKLGVPQTTLPISVNPDKVDVQFHGNAPHDFKKLKVVASVVLDPTQQRADFLADPSDTTVDISLAVQVAGQTIVDQTVTIEIEGNEGKKWKYNRPSGDDSPLKKIKLDFANQSYESHLAPLGSDVPKIETELIGFAATDAEIDFDDVAPGTLTFVGPDGTATLTYAADGSVTTVPAMECDCDDDEVDVVLPFRLTTAVEITYYPDAGTPVDIPVEEGLNYTSSNAKVKFEVEPSILSASLNTNATPKELSGTLTLGADPLTQGVGSFLLEEADFDDIDLKHWKKKKD